MGIAEIQVGTDMGDIGDPWDWSLYYPNSNTVTFRAKRHTPKMKAHERQFVQALLRCRDDWFDVLTQEDRTAWLTADIHQSYQRYPRKHPDLNGWNLYAAVALAYKFHGITWPFHNNGYPRSICANAHVLTANPDTNYCTGEVTFMTPAPGTDPSTTFVYLIDDERAGSKWQRIWTAFCTAHATVPTLTVQPFYFSAPGFAQGATEATFLCRHHAGTYGVQEFVNTVDLID